MGVGGVHAASGQAFGEEISPLPSIPTFDTPVYIDQMSPQRVKGWKPAKRIFYLGARHKMTSLLQSISVIVAATTNQKYLHVAVESFVRFNE